MNVVAKTEAVLLTIWEHGRAAGIYPKSYPELLRDMAEICQAYLLADTELQAQMRQVFELGGAFWYVLAYMREMANAMKSSDDIECLLNGLAAASLCGEDIDTRELDSCLQFLYSKAKAAGLDPTPHFLRVSGMSSTKPGSGLNDISPAELIRIVAVKMVERSRK